MKYKFPLFFILGLLAISLAANSCKKDSSGSINTLFTGNPWQLSSAIRYHQLAGATFLKDTLTAGCDSVQLFTFNTNQTCTYTNFGCKPQPVAKGSWSLSANQLVLMANMTCRINAATGSADTTLQPFINSRVMNVGQYSLVLRTGQYNLYYPATDTVVYIEYGFVRVKKQ